MHLPLLPPDARDAADPAADDGCAGCSRRELLAGLGLGAAALALVGCGGDPEEVTAPDAPMTGTTECGPGLVCVDLGDASNAALLEAGGARVIQTSAGKLIVVRVSATEVVALSAICTHQGCEVRFDATNARLSCPCHGSRFALTGAVLRAPANRALPTYAATLDPARNLIEVALG